MPDLSNLLDSPSPAHTSCFNLRPVPPDSDPSVGDSVVESEPQTQDKDLQQPNLEEVRICSATGGSEAAAPGKSKKASARNARSERERKWDGSRSLEDHVRVWMEKKMAAGLTEKECALPFLVNAPKVVDCRICSRAVYSGDEISCSITSCQQIFHINCVMPISRLSSFKSFKCPQHACIKCKRMGYWRCLICTVAAHKGCAPWPNEVIYFSGHPGRAVCWRHSANWRLEKEHAVPTRDIEEMFHRLPLPYIDEDFNGDFMNDNIGDESIPSPYVHIRRNIYLVKRKRDYADADIGCKNCCDKRCSEDCVCRVQSISCSKACNCSDTCTNRPFRKEKKVRIIKTKFCGWGVEAAQTIKEGEFVIEYIGEVINDALCEQRLWDMKYRGSKNFYMCEIGKNFTIDATFKGNASRFLNHSCDPNCKLEKWQVDGETRVGVFASRLINVGEPLTYDYRFVQFGPMVACRCGATNCQGYLGTKKKIEKMDLLSWGKKRKRSRMPETYGISCIHIPNTRRRVRILH